MQDGDEKVVFTGDTLFHGGMFMPELGRACQNLSLRDADPDTLGCGRFFEGSATEMHKALNKTLASLPDDTKVYVGGPHHKLLWEMSSLTLTSPDTNTPRRM